MAKEKTYDVFISYRRQGGAVKAELTKDELAKRGFRESRMFMDTRSLSSGNYMDIILKAVEQSRNMVVIITKDCLKGLTENSPWAQEIAYAIAQGKTIVPVYFDGITEIDREVLPESIKRLSFENAVIYVHQYADASFDRLAERLSKAPIKLPKWGRWALGAVAAGGLAVGGYSAVENANDALQPGEVYVVASSSAKSYHSTKKCTTLKNARHRIKRMTEEEAVQQGKKPCKRCYNE